MVTPVLLLGQIMVASGLDMVTIQQVEVSDRQVSALFWLNQALGVGVALAIAASGPLLAWYYRGAGRGLADRGDGRHVGGVRPGGSASGPVAAADAAGDAGLAASGGLGAERHGGRGDGDLGLRSLVARGPAILGTAGPGGDDVDRRACGVPGSTCAGRGAGGWCISAGNAPSAT